MYISIEQLKADLENIIYKSSIGEEIIVKSSFGNVAIISEQDFMEYENYSFLLIYQKKEEIESKRKKWFIFFDSVIQFNRN